MPGESMPIPNSQFETWSHQGSITQSSNTYKTLKNVLQSIDAPYANKNYSVFLQGSYGNDTNIYSESDVDIVIKLQSTFQHDLSDMPDDEQKAFKSSHSDATYTNKNFASDVLKVLTDNYGSNVNQGKKAIAIENSASRRKADVIAAIQYRRYHSFKSINNQSYTEGICFYTSTGEQIVNYPKQHSENLTIKHQRTGNFKHMVRIFKNLRSRLVQDGILQDGIAPSYYLEGLLYNVPDDQFVNSYDDTFFNAINWIQNADRSNFVCANEQYYLLRENSPVTWRSNKCDAFIEAAIELWNQW